MVTIVDHIGIETHTVYVIAPTINKAIHIGTMSEGDDILLLADNRTSVYENKKTRFVRNFFGTNLIETVMVKNTRYAISSIETDQTGPLKENPDWYPQ